MAPETNGFRQFIILLYKGMLLRKRHYIVTFFEIVVPVLIASIPAIIMSETSSPSYEEYNNNNNNHHNKPLWINYTTYDPVDPYKLSISTDRNLEIVYCPIDPVLDKFMLDVIEKFRQNAFYSGTIKHKSLKDEAALETYITYQMKKDRFDTRILGTVFNHFEKVLDYKIRFPSSYNTDLKYRIRGPQNYNAYQSTMFLSWQTAVEQTFIERQGKPFDYRVWLQRFPYPEHRDSSNTFSVVNIVPWVIAYGYLMFVINVVRRVIEEKANGSKELLKMMGMTDGIYWGSTFINFFLVGVITTLVITIIYKAPLKNGLIFIKSMNFLILFIGFLLFIASLILFCLAFSIFFKKAVFATVCIIIVYTLTFSLLMSNFFLLDTELSYLPLPVGQKIGICILPPGALLTLFLLISYHESSGDGVQWSNLTDFGICPDLNVLMVLATMLGSCFIYAFLIWYLDAVWPWQPGVPKPFYFPFTRSYWCGYRPVESEAVQLIETEHNTDFFEEEPPGVSPGVVIKNLSKEFRTGFQTKSAVNNVSLNIYHGQITALLGHNGAGKTTTINILTGLYTPSSGSASIRGIDILTDTIKARRGIGVCPQHNVLYDTLTVEEHLKIYSAMKGLPWRSLNSEVDHILKILKLETKKTELIKNLSGGMKRKLSLGIAICAGSKVLFLDEPTSGMDVEARRSVWDTLLELRHDRTIILTTHYMEEADILGDRIAIMAEGEVQCSGSPIFLKQKFGTGYHLHIVKDTGFTKEGVTSMLQKFIPDVTLGNELDKEISFTLVANTTAAFGDMFEELEKEKKSLGIISFGITITTMEDVFLQVANLSDMKYKMKNNQEAVNGSILEMEDVYGENAQFKRRRDYLNVIIALLLKRFNYAKRYWSVLAAQIGLPIALMCLCFYILRSASGQYGAIYTPLKMDLNAIYGKTDGFYYSKNPQFQQITSTFQNVLSRNAVSARQVDNPTHYVLDYAKNNIAKYVKSFMVGGAIDKYASGDQMNLTAWYNGEPYHSLPISLNMMHTTILRHVAGPDAGLVLTNAPISENTRYISQSDTKAIFPRTMAAVFVPLALSYLSGSFVLIPTHERVSKAKLMQLMTGMPAFVYWSTMFAFDFMVHCFVSILMIIPFAIFSHHVFFGVHSEAIGSALLLFFLYGWASIPFSYIISFLFKKGSTGFSFIEGFCAIFGCGLGTTLRVVQISFGGVDEAMFKKIGGIIWGFRIFPTFSVASGFSSLFGIAYANAFCESVGNLDSICDDTLEDWNAAARCCPNICIPKGNCLQQVNPINFDFDGIGQDAMFLALDGFIYFAILLFLETTLMTQFGLAVKKKVKQLLRKPVVQVMEEKISEDPDVLQEETRIREWCSTHPGAGGEALAVLGLTRIYRNFYAVDHLTFGIHSEECFGLLGVNGAGKTTTFRMLVGDCVPTEGTAIIDNVSIQSDLKKFQSYLGYCPQFDALIDRLSGREMLHLFGRLRGLSGEELTQRVKKLIKMTDLTAHADKQTQFYSGGNKRKLSVALALIGSPPLLLLDEPTAGVDPVSRRKIWNILSQARSNTGAAVILTTHSMEESEALCNRLAIMVNGRFRCLGSIQELKSKYGQGYSLIIKMKREQQHDYQAINEIKQHIDSNFQGANLKDDHQGMLQYHIVDPSTTLSRLFKFMSRMKVEFELEDYLISDTSLEQIFLAFARSQRIVG